MKAWNVVASAVVSATIAIASLGAMAQQPISLRLSSNDRPGGHIDVMVRQFAETVGTRTNGQVRIQVFPNHTLANGNFRTELELTRAGTIDIAVNSTIIFGLFVDRKFDVFSIPFNIADHEEFGRVLDGPMGNKLREWGSEHGYTVLGLSINGFRQLTNSRRRVASPEDIRGLKLRVAGTEVFLSAFRRMGADAVTMNAQEMVQAMAQGVVDGQENPFISIQAFRLWEANQRYVTRWNYVVDPMLLYMSTRRFQSLPADVQKIMIEEAGKAGVALRAAAAELDEAAVRELRQRGVEITDLTPEQISAFRAVMAPLADEFGDRIGRENIALLQREVARVRQEMGRR